MAGALSFRHASRLNPAAVPPTGWRATHRPARPSRQPGASAAARQCMHTAWAATWQRPSKEAEGVIRRLPLLGTYGRFESWAAFRKSLNLLERETRLELATSTLAKLPANCPKCWPPKEFRRFPRRANCSRLDGFPTVCAGRFLRPSTSSPTEEFRPSVNARNRFDRAATIPTISA